MENNNLEAHTEVANESLQILINFGVCCRIGQINSFLGLATADFEPAGLRPGSMFAVKVSPDFRWC